MSGSTTMDVLGTLGYSICDGSLGSALIEMKEVYQERLPYTTVLLLDGSCYVWGEAFISNIITAISTDNLTGMTAEERRMWYEYVEWTDHNTNSADLLLEPLAIGCTIPNEIGNSYAVLPDGTVTGTLCNDPLYDIANPDLYKSLDNVLMNILNCLPYNECGADEGEVYSIYDCPET